MRKTILGALFCLALPISNATAEPLKDVHDLKLVHEHIKQAIHEMAEAQARNHYDMAGHGERVERLLKDAERELREAIEAARRAR